DDHVAGIPFLKDTFGTQVWAPEVFADVLTDPHRFRLPAVWRQPIPVDRRLATGAALEWEEFRFEVAHVPGHTWYAAAFFGEVDGRRIGITSDEIQLDRRGRLRGGGPVHANRVLSGDFATGIETVRAYRPELLLTGHDGALEVQPADFEH